MEKKQHSVWCFILEANITKQELCIKSKNVGSLNAFVFWVICFRNWMKECLFWAMKRQTSRDSHKVAVLQSLQTVKWSFNMDI